MDLIVIVLFVIVLGTCIIFHIPTLLALLTGYVLLFLYALKKGLKSKEIGTVSISIQKLTTVMMALIMCMKATKRFAYLKAMDTRPFVKILIRL